MIRPPLPSPGARLQELMSQGALCLPGAFNALSALAAFKSGAQAVYLSGGAITNCHLGAPDIGLMTLTEMAETAARACQAAPIPMICDADTGFGEAWNVARTVIEMERAGLAGIHLEDQQMPKRCGHLDGKSLISPDAMAEKIRAAVASRRDPSFQIIARTDAAGVESMGDAIKRSKSYVKAGADVIFPEGLVSEQEFAEFRRALSGPLLANMTEFGRTPLLTVSDFERLGYQLVIFPVSAMRVMLKAVEDFYTSLLLTGTQADWMNSMRTRAELYDLVDYQSYQESGISWTESQSSKPQ